MKWTTDKAGCASRGIKFGLLALVGVAAVTWVVMLLWNGLLPDLFSGVSRIGYWQALGMLVLSRILFGGLRGGHAGHWRERHAHWNNLTIEERQQLKGRLHGRWSCCSTPSKAEESGNNSASADKPSEGA